jgi:hypothetical protein
LNEPVRQCRFPVIDVCDDAEVSNVFHGSHEKEPTHPALSPELGRKGKVASTRNRGEGKVIKTKYCLIYIRRVEA